MATGNYKTIQLSYLIAISLLLKISKTTINVNLAQFEYLANHLTLDECHKLIASLHVTTYKLNKNFFDEAISEIPDDVSCLNLLLEWNSAPGEGKGQTHEIISHRLIQIGRKDLSQWLEKSVFKELADELNISDKSAEETNNTTTDATELTNFNSATVFKDKESSEKLSTLILILAIIIVITTCAFLTALCINHFKNIKQQAELTTVSISKFRTKEEETNDYLQEMEEERFSTYDDEDDYLESTAHTPLINRHS